MAGILVIPIPNKIEESLALAEKYGAGFEFNDFFMPDVLDSEERQDRIIAEYNCFALPKLRTVHGAFFDVIPFSPDSRIREISDTRIKQSISAARKAGASAVVFHTNYNPFLNTPEYVRGWIDNNEKYWSGVLEENPDMNIYLENMFDRSPDIMADLSERLCEHKNYGVCLDYAHAALTPVSHSEWVSRLGRYVKHMHINDNNSDCDSHLAIGDGKIDWNEFYGLYEKYMSGATVLVETSFIDRQERSLEKLRKDGFID